MAVLALWAWRPSESAKMNEQAVSGPATKLTPGHLLYECMYIGGPAGPRCVNINSPSTAGSDSAAGCRLGQGLSQSKLAYGVPR